MKKKLVIVMASLLILSFMTGCAAYAVAPVTGVLYSDVKSGMAATSADNSSKVGTATAQSILGLVAVGDASIETAMKNGNITKVHHIDYYSKSILGIYATYTIQVYGE
jgi:tellurite resistance protein